MMKNLKNNLLIADENMCRDMKKGEEAAKDILLTTGNKVELLPLDLADTGYATKLYTAGAVSYRFLLI
jgi:short-subunit dehydrogenase